MSAAGVLFDIDGTLVDSNDAHARAWVEALAENGREVPFERMRPLIGMGGDKLLPAVTGLADDSPEGKKIVKRRQEIFQERHLPKLRPTPGAEALVRHLRERGHRLVAATSAKEGELDGLLRVCGCQGLLDGATSSDDADSSKPDPDIVQAALRQLGRPAREAVMIGDTPYDVEAAARAGVATVALRCGGWRDAELKGAAAIYDDPADLLRHYDESPLARPRG